MTAPLGEGVAPADRKRRVSRFGIVAFRSRPERFTAATLAGSETVVVAPNENSKVSSLTAPCNTMHGRVDLLD